MSTTESYLWGLAGTAHIIPGLLLLSPNTQRRASLQRYGLSFHLEMTNMDGHLEGFTNTCPYFFHTFYITLFPKIQLWPHGQIPLRKESVSAQMGCPRLWQRGLQQCSHNVGTQFCPSRADDSSWMPVTDPAISSVPVQCPRSKRSKTQGSTGLVKSVPCAMAETRWWEQEFKKESTCS